MCQYSSFANCRFGIVDIPFQIQLQKEYSNGIIQIIWLYDVNCKFKTNCFQRCFYNKYSPLEEMFQRRLLDPKFILFLVNVWHGNSHKPECSDQHSLRNTPRTGMVTGEEIETGWPRLNKKQWSTREMDAGARADTITVHVIEHNRDKILRIGGCHLVNKLQRSSPYKTGNRLEKHYEHCKSQAELHCQQLEDLEGALNELDSEIIPRYRKLFEQRGGEQFRPDARKFSCMSPDY
jgi:hypothetical protein